jgi:hypothetical protein
VKEKNKKTILQVRIELKKEKRVRNVSKSNFGTRALFLIIETFSLFYGRLFIAQQNAFAATFMTI